MGKRARTRGVGMLFSAAVGIALVGCGSPEEEAELPRAESPDPALVGGPASVYWRSEVAMTRDELERGRLDAAWRSFADRDRTRRQQSGAGAPGAARGAEAGDSATGGAGSASGPAGAPSDSATAPDSAAAESWDDIGGGDLTPASVRLPVGGEAEGPSVLALQVLLDLSRFSPGVIDGRWGKNTEKAVYWFQHAEGLPATGTLDSATLDRLVTVAGVGEETLVRPHTLTAEEVEGPFVDLPEDVYERAELDCLCYETPTEKLSELFHTTPELLARLNPDVDLDAVSAGTALRVPAVAGRTRQVDDDAVVRIVVSDGGHYVHALGRSGKILYHFPSTLGSEYSPSPSGDYRVTAVAFDPEWHYQPELLEGEPDEAEDAVLPPGPNSAVGVVWISLSKPHFGIHGTSAPETIGYATSSGCVRLTNWDARFLAERVGMGVAVEFTGDGVTD